MERLGYLGPRGTHSEEVALYLASAEQARGGRYELVPHASIYEAIRAVADEIIDCCAVPVENSIEGSINITLDTLAHDVDLQVAREIVWTVHNQLMVKHLDAPITTILSHPQPLAQCREYIKAHYGNAEIRQVASTARAAEIVAGEKAGYAAIGTSRAGEVYGLTKIADDIQDNFTNCTRFLILKKRGATLLSGSGKTSLICQINGEKAGSLCEVLMEFAARGVNLTRIESRPARTGLGEYIFFLDLDAPCDPDNVKSAIDALAQKSLWVKNLGSYDVTCYDKKNKAEGR